MTSPWIALAGIVVYFSSEKLLRRGRARSFRRGSFDRRTTLLVSSTLVLSVTGPWVARALFATREAPAVLVVGVSLVMAMGIALRFWAMHVLGESFTRTLTVRPEQFVVSSGPYRVIRHPGYCASLITFSCYAYLVWPTWMAPLGVLAAVGGAYAVRIPAEETMLVCELGEAYEAYRQRTWRLIPGLF